ncbi:hypothetical protein GYB43_16095 [bacterium]|jgi:hypothetical protein|nr:hypothetical protein [bacterium]
MDLKKTLLLVGLSSGLANADIESALTASYGSEYIYRGVNVGDDHVSLNLTASGEAAGLTWNAGLLHGSTETTDETRMMLGVSKSLSDSLSVNVGMMNTSLLAAGDLREVYAGVSTALAGIDLSGTVFFNQNDALATDSYYELSASYHHCMGDGLGATLAVSYGNWDEDPSGANEDVDALAISLTLNKDLGGGLEGSLGVTHQISDTPISEDETVVGASVTFSF